MNIIDSVIFNHVIKEQTFEIGQLYFFEHLILIQINDGMHVSIDTAQDCFKAIYDFYGTEKPFGYISNRINEYSIEVLDYPKHNSLFPNLKMYGVIGYSQINEMNFNIERQFCDIPYIEFKNLNDAYTYVNNYVLNKSFTNAS
ncbi:hypothetical protein [Olleya aquimaris]|uniref:STAS/SEC14 domain-containing protein n=1 Tax=Olleya aquimaris TaxID=639310 RepID=A0A327RGY2_9FLAO|nr:hypothetical protein [Olleya aquimaris]RAJ16290.1 hypothetical protein LY08_01148 [Olleya aquimaris]